ncbi:MAG: AbrB/MazE/SpoVT family DNA-binding domain-containing protein [Candidatus Magasanikbacteria bacterium]|nr:AbrB/MazE/SpoVT family DNA-binding domain-containing protein [Candidatus Magasanikbacteria bacterium]
MGVRGQVVIPKKIREKLKIKSGDNFLVMEKNGAIIFIPTQQVKKMMSFISKELNKIN